ncbi:hypothetical protein, partial [Stenotrophomonas maltophilia]|uniref:hypothetical protein n=1 Tax=Stenotrophomonas maltophilia TaxID=40324 RepID=UPI00313BDC9D
GVVCGVCLGRLFYLLVFYFVAYFKFFLGGGINRLLFLFSQPPLVGGVGLGLFGYCLYMVLFFLGFYGFVFVGGFVDPYIA